MRIVSLLPGQNDHDPVEALLQDVFDRNRIADAAVQIELSIDIDRIGDDRKRTGSLADDPETVEIPGRHVFGLSGLDIGNDHLPFRRIVHQSIKIEMKLFGVFIEDLVQIDETVGIDHL